MRRSGADNRADDGQPRPAAPAARALLAPYRRGREGSARTRYNDSRFEETDLKKLPKKRASAGAETPESVRLAEKGVASGAEIYRLMGALIGDIAVARVSTKWSRAVLRETGKVLREWDKTGAFPRTAALGSSTDWSPTG